MKHYVYYLINSLDKQPFYVGKGQGSRMSAHWQPSQQKYNPIKARKMAKIIAAGGDILYEVFPCETEEQAFELERARIKEYGKICDGTGILTNLDNGGRGGSSGRPITESTRIKLKARKRVLHTPRARQKIADAHRHEKTIEVRASIQKNTKNIAPVCQYDVSGKLLAEYISARDAGKRTGIDNSYISQCCSGRYKTAGGFIWKYKSHKPARKTKQAVEQISDDGCVIATYPSIKAAAASLETSINFISRACNNPQYTALGFYWRKV